jgi:hypothetical protein
MRRIIVLCALLTSFLALPAFAIPGIGAIYGGIGTHTYRGFPGQSGTDYGATLELGIDDIIQKWGVGARFDLPSFTSFNPAANVEVRYSILSVPFFRVIGGVFGGVQKNVGTTGTYGVFGAARVSMGLPYLGVNLGFQGQNTYLSAFGQITVGAVF